MESRLVRDDADCIYDFVDNFLFVTVKPSQSCFEKFSENPITRHAGLLLMFATFNVILPLSDFITDILTSQTYFQRGHFYWGFCTMLFVFLPFFGRLVMFFQSILKLPINSLMLLLFKKNEDENKKLYPSKMIEFKVLFRGSPELIWHIPPLIIIRSVLLNILFLVLF